MRCAAPWEEPEMRLLAIAATVVIAPRVVVPTLRADR